jgi:nucleoside-diphosphate-sugar epimerase
MGMTVAITGAAGFLGRSLTPALRDDPAIGRVIAIDRTAGDMDGVEWVLADVRDESLADRLRGADVVVHLAFVVLGDLREADDINVRGSANVFDAAAKAGCRRIVFASSVAAYGYGLPDRLLTEEDPIKPIPRFAYSRTKGAAERALDATLAANPALEGVRLRPSIILGPKSHDLLMLLSSARAVLRPGRRAGAIQVVYVDDVVEAFRLATVGPASGAYNVAAPGPVSYRELAELTGKPLLTIPEGVARLGSRASARFRPKLGLDAGWVMIAQRPPLVSTVHAERELGWRAARTGHEAFTEFLRTTRSASSSTKERATR